MKRNKNLPEGLIDMADVPYVSPSETIRENIKKYGWEDNKEYYQKRLKYIFSELNRYYDLELAREKQSLYHINTIHINFMDDMGSPSDWARL